MGPQLFLVQEGRYVTPPEEGIGAGSRSSDQVPKPKPWIEMVLVETRSIPPVVAIIWRTVNRPVSHRG